MRGRIWHSNRSQQGLDNSLQQAPRGSDPALAPASSASTVAQLPTSSILPGDGDKAYEGRSARPPSYANARDDVHDYLPASPPLARDSSRAYQDASERPLRSQSQRISVGYPSIPPPSSLDDQAADNYGRPYSTVGDPRIDIRPDPRPDPRVSQQQQPPPDQKKSKSRSFFGFKSSRAADPPSSPEQQSSTYNNLGGLGRRISIRHKEAVPSPSFQVSPLHTSNEKPSQIPAWQSAQSSDTQLPSPHEEDEDENHRHPYIIHPSDGDIDRAPDPRHEQLQNPSIRVASGDQESTVRLVDEGWQQRYQQQQPPPLLTQQQWLVQNNQLAATSPVPISPVSQQQPDYPPSNPQLGQYQGYHNPSHQPPSNVPFRSNTNPEVISQLSHESPTESSEEQRPVSVQSNTQMQPPGGNYPPQQQQQQQSEFPPRVTSVQATRPLGPQSGMSHPPAPPGSNRRSTDVKQTQPEGRTTAPPPSYSQQQYATREQGTAQGPSNPSSAGSGAPQGANYRASNLQREYSGQPGGAGEQGRSTPPLPGERTELSEMDKLVIKYKKVKGLYFEKAAQVEQLQNTLANQRLSQSRTSLDDSEYATRFNRLDGAIKEIAFSIRKDWKTIPRWLMPYVNQDAQKVGTKEMTAVGRAAISRWIADEIFQKCFHPGLDLALSAELKRIEHNIRLYASPSTNQEESDMLTSKVVQWKMSTVAGLGFTLNSSESHEAKTMFTQMAVTNLTAHLLNHLQDPAPQGIEGNATSIVELAVGIACHLPLESREIAITYPMPGDQVQSWYKVEAPLPALENPFSDPSAEPEVESKDPVAEEAGKGEPQQGNVKLIKKQQDRDRDRERDRNKNAPPAQLVTQGSINGRKPSVSTTGGQGESGSEKTKDHRADGSGKIRYAGFMGVEVRGRQWLINPPVWTIS